jgi:hypothetical protein
MATAAACNRRARRGYPSLPHIRIASPAGSAARSGGVGQRSSHWAWTGSTRLTGVCCSMYSETITDHGVAEAERHGRSRACSSYHRSSGS